MAGAAYICMRYFLFALFTVTLGQMLIAQAFKQAKADIPIASGLGDHQAICGTNFAYSILWAGTGKHEGFKCGKVITAGAYL